MKRSWKMLFAAVAIIVIVIGAAYAAVTILYPMSAPVARDVVLEDMQGNSLPNPMQFSQAVYENSTLQLQVHNIGYTNTAIVLSVVSPVGATVMLDLVGFNLLPNGRQTITMTFSDINPSVSSVSWTVSLSFP